MAVSKYAKQLKMTRIVSGRAKGESVKSIADDLGVSHQAVSAYLKKEDVKDWIEQEHLKYLQDVPTARENMGDLVRNMKNTEDKDERKLAFEASKEILKSAGIIPSNTQSTFIQNIYGQNNLVLSPLLKEMLESHAKSLEWKDDVEDAEIGTKEV